jgi:hypothetical protein
MAVRQRGKEQFSATAVPSSPTERPELAIYGVGPMLGGRTSTTREGQRYLGRLVVEGWAMPSGAVDVGYFALPGPDTTKAASELAHELAAALSKRLG